jgi:acetyl-CoA acetyltransferase
MAFRRYCDRYGYDADLIAAVAIAFREHARLNPRAQMTKPMEMADYLAEPFIVEPLRRPDFALLSDGGGCVIVTTLDRARDLRKPPVVIGGMQGLHAGDDEFIFAPPGLGVFSQGDERRPPKNSVYAMADLEGPDDIDSLQIYDAFSPNLVFVLERFGFASEGEGLNWVQDGRIGPGGALPVNTAGGLLSEAHICGWGHMIEATRQVREEAGRRQIPNCDVVQWPPRSVTRSSSTRTGDDRTEFPAGPSALPGGCGPSRRCGPRRNAHAVLPYVRAPVLAGGARLSAGFLGGRGLADGPGGRGCDLLGEVPQALLRG